MNSSSSAGGVGIFRGTGVQFDNTVIFPANGGQWWRSGCYETNVQDAIPAYAISGNSGEFSNPAHDGLFTTDGDIVESTDKAQLHLPTGRSHQRYAE